MEKSKLKTLTIIGLVVLNLISLAFVYLNASGKRQHPMMGEMGPRKMIVKKLHFDENQKMEFQKLIEWHKGEIQKHDEVIRNAKIELYSLLAENNVDVNAKEVLINVINQNQKEIEEAHFKHFEDIKKLCKANQIEDFNNLSKELPRVFGPRKGKREPRERHPND